MIQPRETLDVMDFQKYLQENLKRLEETGQPEVLSIKGGSEIVVQNYSSYIKMLEQLDRLDTILNVRQGLEDVKNGKTISFQDFVKKMKEDFGADFQP